jgi:predicted alpha/beta hydrolase
MLSLSFTDDEMMSAKSTETLHRFYAGATIERRRLSPIEIGVSRIGHFGFFRRSFAATLWPLTTQWMESRR